MGYSPFHPAVLREKIWGLDFSQKACYNVLEYPPLEAYKDNSMKLLPLVLNVLLISILLLASN